MTRLERFWNGCMILWVVLVVSPITGLRYGYYPWGHARTRKDRR